MAQGLRRTVTMIFAAGTTVCSMSLTGASGAAAGTQTPARATARGGTWGTAEEIPGTASLNQGGAAVVHSLSCGATGNCSAVGDYTDGSGANRAFVASEVDGAWHTAEEVPGTAALNWASIVSVSCASAGNCSAGGDYPNPGGQAFVVSQANGTWGTIEEVPGTAALNKGGNASIVSVSCASAGNCSAGGGYADSSGTDRAFVVTQANGTWQTARQLPGTAVLGKNGAQVTSVSCRAPGDCSAAGWYLDGSNDTEVFVASQVNGTWHSAEEVPGIAALNKGGNADIYSVSCGTPGNCAAGGYYVDGSGDKQVFVVTESHGRWGTTRRVPGIVTHNDGAAGVYSVSCAAVGNCSAGGSYAYASAGDWRAFVVNEVNGTWRTARLLPGTSHVQSAEVYSVSCAAAGDCSAGGYYTTSTALQAFVASESNGRWGAIEPVPGLPALNQGDSAATYGVSCATAASCSAAGTYSDNDFNRQVFVVNKT